MLSIALAGCSSTKSSPGGTEGHPARIAFVSYASAGAGKRIELVNESHSNRAELYSQRKSLEDAVTKVTTDEVMDEIVKLFRARGVYERAQKGAAPADGGGTFTQALEIDTPDFAGHWALLRGASSEERQRFLECAQAFVMIYNDTYQLQSVDRAPDAWNSDSTRPSEPAKSSSTSSKGGG
ncbi:MAG: hypothetical protein ACKVWV_12195 [Planctomycetota bacterium]